MYLLIEHNGTEAANDLAVALKNVAEDNFGATCEFVISDIPDIGIYNEDQKELIRFTGPRSNEDLNYIINFIYEDDEDKEAERRKKARKKDGLRNISTPELR